MPTYPNLDRLKATLANSGIAQQNPALFQVISQLIDAVRQSNQTTQVDTGSSSSGVASLAQRNYLTHTDETASLPNSRELLAGDNVTFDDSVAGERTIDVAVPDGIDYVVCSDGGLPTPLPIDDGFGNFIYIPYSA